MSHFVDVGRPVGRPRDAGRESALLDATLALLGEVGYDNLTIDAVAARAGAGKATVYRRWHGKADLVCSALSCSADRLQTPIDTGSLRGDVQALVAQMRAKSEQGGLAPMVGMIGAAHHDAELAAAFRGGVVRDRQVFVTAILERARDRGEIGADADVDLLRDLVAGLVFHRLLVTGEPVDEAVVDRLVDLMALTAR